MPLMADCCDHSVTAELLMATFPWSIWDQRFGAFALKFQRSFPRDSDTSSSNIMRKKNQYAPDPKAQDFQKAESAESKQATTELDIPRALRCRLPISGVGSRG